MAFEAFPGRGRSARCCSRAGVAVTEGDLCAYVEERLAVYKYPRIVVITDALPPGATGKILKFHLQRVIAGRAHREIVVPADAIGV